MWLEDGHIGQRRYNRRVVVKSSGKHKSSAHTVYALQLLIFCARLCFTSQPACWSHNFSSQLTRRYLPLGRPAKALSPHYPLSPPPCHCHSRSNEQIICQKCTHFTVSISFTSQPPWQAGITNEDEESQAWQWLTQGLLGWEVAKSRFKLAGSPEPELCLLGQWVSLASCGPLVSHGNRFWGCNQHLFFLLASTLITSMTIENIALARLSIVSWSFISLIFIYIQIRMFWVKIQNVFLIVWEVLHWVCFSLVSL